MEYKAYDSYNDTMYLNAQWIDSDGWNLSKMMRNKWFKVSHSIGLYDKNDVMVFTNDIIVVNNTPYVVSEEPYNGVYIAYNMKDIEDSIEMNTVQSNNIEVLGSKFEVENKYK